MTQRAELRIESIAAGGDGVARVGGLVVFVPRTAPGDVAVVEIEPQGRFARGRMLELVAPSPERVDPPCPHYTVDHCGGCQLQHVAYGAQLEAKARIVRDALARIGRRELPAPDVRPSPREWRYRRKLTLAMRARADGWIAGLHPYDAPAAVFPLDDCPITDERVIAVWREIQRAAGDLPRTRELRGAVRMDDEGPAFVLEGGTAWTRRAAFWARVPSLVSLWWEPARGHGRGRRERLFERAPARAPGASFTQVNPAAAAEMQGYLVERVLAHAPATVIDGYAGLGDTAAVLAARGVRVTAIELDPDAAAWSARRLPTGSRSVAARVEDALPDALPADVVILNPPRAGVDAGVTAVLEHARPRARAVIYVSCNPATLARDLTRLPGWRVTDALVFDLFPQTAHVETVCELVPGAE